MGGTESTDTQGRIAGSREAARPHSPDMAEAECAHQKPTQSMTSSLLGHSPPLEGSSQLPWEPGGQVAERVVLRSAQAASPPSEPGCAEPLKTPQHGHRRRQPVRQGEGPGAWDGWREDEGISWQVWF